MLIEFRTENHRSLKTEQVLTMEAGRVDGDATIPRTVPGYSKPLLPVAALYGANASGKSNVLNAFAFMIRAVTESLWLWKPDDKIRVDPFAWGDGTTAASTFEAAFIQNDVRYQYGFAADREKISEEWLHCWPKGRRQTWFHREDMTFSFSDHLKGYHKPIEGVTRPNVLFLTVAAHFGMSQFENVFRWFRQTNPWNLVPQRSILEDLEFSELFHTPKQRTLFEFEDSGFPAIDDFKLLLSQADVGISDIKAEEVADRPNRRGRLRYFLKHDPQRDDSWLPLDQESQGTKTMFRMAVPLLNCLRRGGRIMIDELEASLHPKLAIEIVKQFNNPATNPNNAQLIFTTHDTNLLGNDAGEPVLRRDQVWLTEKDKEGATVLYPLTDYKPRKAENVERGYLQGRYGAIPYLGNFSLLGKESP